MKIILKYTKKYLPAVLLLLVSLVANIVLQIRKTGMVEEIVDGILASPTDAVMISKFQNMGIYFLLIILGMAAAALTTALLAAYIATGISRDLRDDLYSHIMTFSMKEMNHFSIPVIISRCTNDVSTVQDFMQQFLVGALAVPFLIVGGLVCVFQDQSSMAWIMGLGVGLVLLLFVFMISRMIPVVRKLVTQTDDLHRYALESLTGVPILKALNREAWGEKRIREGADRLRGINVSYSTIEAIIMPSMYLILNIMNLVVVWVGAQNVSTGLITAGQVFSVINYLYMTIYGVIAGCIIGLQLPRVTVCLKRLREILDVVPTIQDPDQPCVLPESFDVAFEDVSFCYDPDGGDVIRHISFTAKQGEITAIIGNTGCGKSTIMEMIPRLYDPREGKVSIGGIDVKRFSLKELRAVVGLVPQKARLFSGTVRSNIAFRDPDTDEKCVTRAAEVSQSLSFITNKTDGFDSKLTSGDSNVSGGQRQRLTIARALCEDPKVLLLDDSSSALDYDTDVRLREAIREHEKNATVIIVSQRISSIRNADRIIVMRDGEIMGSGTHEKLKSSCPAYREILRSQMEDAQ